MGESATIKRLNNGDILFKEGDPSGSAYVVVSGAVELTKNSRHGGVVLATLKQGELFGEMGIIDASPRSATARAVGKTVLKEISPDNLMNGIQNDPDLSSKVMTKLVERLRQADEMLARAGLSHKRANPSTSPASPSTPKKKPGLFSRLFGSQKGRQAPFEIIVADFVDDNEKQITQTIFDALSTYAERQGGVLVNVRRADSAFALTDFSESALAFTQIREGAQKWLSDLEGDLLVWGQARADGQMIHIRFAQSHPPRQDRAGLIRPFDALDLPVVMDDVLKAFLYGTTIGALVPVTKEQRDGFDALLGPALNSAHPIIQKKMRDLTGDELARIETAMANLLATCGLVGKNSSHLKAAEELYVKVLRNLRRSKLLLQEGIIKRHLGYTQSAWFDLGGEKNLLEAAVESLRESCDTFNKTDYPLEWADTQAYIGQLLFKKDHLDDTDQALTESIAAYQSALQVFSASTTPYRWGEAKHHLARALQLLGSQRGDLEMIARAAESCREALVVRSKTRTPMLWAATQNNLGSALFMLCQKTRKPETADAAVRAFQAALEIYELRRATKLASVTQKNLSRAQEIAIDLGALTLQNNNIRNENFSIEDFEPQDETSHS